MEQEKYITSTRFQKMFYLEGQRNFENYVIKGDVYFSDITITEHLSFKKVIVEGTVIFENVEFTQGLTMEKITDPYGNPKRVFFSGTQFGQPPQQD